MDIIIKNGKIFLEDKFVEKDILIQDGKIIKIGSNLKGDKTVDAHGYLVLPGLIDPHVHMREPGATYKEDFYTGSRAAIAGGFTTVIDMPNNPEPTITKERIDEKIKLAKQKAICDVLFHFGGTDNNFDEVNKADPLSMKIYLGKTTGDLMLSNPNSLELHYKNFSKNKPIVLHCGSSNEDPEKNVDETIQITENAISLAIKTNRKIHLAHASTKKEVTLAKRSKNCTVEVAPHHLFLSSKDAERLGPFGKVYPILRSEQKQLMLQSSFDLIDCIATDHAPHTSEDKEDGAAGFPGLETSLGLMLTACNLGLFDKISVIQKMSHNVADVFNIQGKGRIKSGYIADITIVDPKKEWNVNPNEFYTKAKWSPFDGRKLKGKVKTVLKDGKIIFDDYHFIH